MNETALTPILSAVGGRWGWRYWWPAVPWLVDVLMVVTFRPQAATEPAGVLLLTSLFCALPLWLWGARFAVSLGHARRNVYPVALLTTFTVPCLWGAVSWASDVVAGDFQAWKAMPLFVFYGLPSLCLILLLCTLTLGYGWRGTVVAIAGWGVMAATYYLWLWNFLDAVTGSQVFGGLAAMALFVPLACWIGWFGFRYART